MAAVRSAETPQTPRTAQQRACPFCRLRIRRDEGATRLMQLRARLAGLLTVLLLSVSCFAAQCELRCELALMGAPCHESVASHTHHQTMPRMAAMPSRDVPPGGAAGAALSSTHSTCAFHACAHQPAFVLEQKSGIGMRSVVGLVPLEARVGDAPEPAIAALASRGPPLFRPASPIALRTTLRL